MTNYLNETSLNNVNAPEGLCCEGEFDSIPFQEDDNLIFAKPSFAASVNPSKVLIDSAMQTNDMATRTADGITQTQMDEDSIDEEQEEGEKLAGLSQKWIDVARYLQDEMGDICFEQMVGFYVNV